MLTLDYTILLFAICIAAILYSSVGHGGASGYLAAMALFGLEPSVMKPAALTMNVFVTILVLYRYREIRFKWNLFVPLMIFSLPLAYWGGTLAIESKLYMLVVGLLLLIAAIRMFWYSSEQDNLCDPKLWLLAIVGGILGFISGLTGVGGGIYLSPLLLLFRWTYIKDSIPIVAAFIMTNSLAALAGYISVEHFIPESIPLFVVMAVIGAFIGTEIASKKLAPDGLRRVLGVVLVVAGSKMIISA